MITKSTISVNGGAMPKANQRTVMVRAWQIFREKYGYPRIKFSDIGRHCFAYCLRRAWAEHKQAAAIAAIPAAEKAERIANLNVHIERLNFGSDWSRVRREIEACRAEIALLSAKEVHAHA